GGVPQLQLRPEIAAASPVPMAIPGVLSGGVYPSRWMPDEVRVKPDATGDPRISGSAPGSSRTVPNDVSAVGTLPASVVSGFSRTPPAVRPMIALGQFRDTFIIAVDDEGVAIVDQHVAHERVLFERLMEHLTQGTLESQRLLAPLVLELQ